MGVGVQAAMMVRLVLSDSVLLTGYPRRDGSRIYRVMCWTRRSVDVSLTIFFFNDGI